MTASIDLTQFSFHDANLVRASHHGSTIVLRIEYFDDDDAEVSALATISGVNTITQDDITIKEFKMETPDGEIYRLEQDDQAVILIVFWHEYSSRSKTMRTYKMYGEELRLQAREENSGNNAAS